jgi:hypothetical protein
VGKVVDVLAEVVLLVKDLSVPLLVAIVDDANISVLKAVEIAGTSVVVELEASALLLDTSEVVVVA